MLPLFLNYVVVYVVYPYVLELDSLTAFNVVFLFSYFSMLSNMNLGVSIYLTKTIAKTGTDNTNIYILMLFLFVVSILASYLIIIVSGFATTAIMFCAPLLVLIGLYRGYLEGLHRFFKSYLLRALTNSIIPLLVVFYLLRNYPGFEVLCFGFLVAACPFFWLIVGRYKEIEFEPFLRSLKKMLPYILQFLYLIAFVFFDRYLVSYFYGRSVFSGFVVEFEQTYRAIVPVLFLGSVLFPLLSSKSRAENLTAIRHGKYGFLAYAMFCICYPVILSYIYIGFGFGSTAQFYSENALIISLASILLGFAALLQRYVLAKVCESVVVKIYILNLILVTFFGAAISLLFLNAVLTLLIKSLIEIFVTSIFIWRSSNAWRSTNL